MSKDKVKVVVAVHGIGSQSRCATIQSVATRFATDIKPPLASLPLGYFHVPDAARVEIKQLQTQEWGDRDPRKLIYFAEVYWADIPRKVATADDTLEEAKAWGRSVVSRAHAAYDLKVCTKAQGKQYKQGELQDKDFHLAAGVVDEIVETVGVMENLLAILGKAGLFKFELAPILRDYIGDVQIFADFPYYRNFILARFHSVMEWIDAKIARDFPDKECEIFIVAHSEGTVVSFLGLLEALSGRRAVHPEVTSSRTARLNWVRHVHGFMTLGSPIDKHLVLWDKIWDGLKQVMPVPDKQIKWRNYYDFGDPIGFKLDTAEKWIRDGNRFPAFDFETKKHDFGFSRYYLPGKAHVDYWKDKDVFMHFINEVVLGHSATPPKSSPIKGAVSTAIPYLLSMGLHSAGIYLLYKAVASYMVQSHVSTGDTFRNVILLALLLMGVTFAARVPRLTNPRRLLWPVVSAIGFLLLAWPLWQWGPAQASISSDLLGSLIQQQWDFGFSATRTGIAALIMAAGLMALTGWFVPRRQIRLGKRLLLGLGTTFVALLVTLKLLQPAPLTVQDTVAAATAKAALAARDAVAAVQTLPVGPGSAAAGAVQDAARAAEAAASAAQAAAPSSTGDAPLWPVVLAFGIFLYAWWLAILVFDLAFIWHRYIRCSVATDALRYWDRGEDLPLTLAISRQPSTPQAQPQTQGQPAAQAVTRTLRSSAR